MKNSFKIFFLTLFVFLCSCTVPQKGQKIGNKANLYGGLSLFGQTIKGDSNRVSVFNIYRAEDALHLAEEHCKKFNKKVTDIKKKGVTGYYECGLENSQQINSETIIDSTQKKEDSYSSPQITELRPDFEAAQIPLVDFLKKNQPNISNKEEALNLSTYMAIRCSSLYIYGQAKLHNMQNKKSQMLVQIFINNAFLMQNLAVDLYLKLDTSANFDKASKYVFSLQEEMTDTYLSDGKKIYSKTGNWLDYYIKSDLVNCNAFVNLVDKK